MQTSLSKAFRCLYFHLGLVFKIPNKVIFQKTQNTHRIKSLFPDKDRLNRSQMSKVVYKASCWDCLDFYIGKTTRRLHDRKTEHFKAITSNGHLSAIAELVTSTVYNLKWHHFDILLRGKSNTDCKIKEALLISNLKPALNENISSEKLYYTSLHNFMQIFPSVTFTSFFLHVN